MTDDQWQKLATAIQGRALVPPIGFIIDSPWLPNWHGISILDYFSSEESWFRANRQATETFPDICFLPGFWSEFGMCTEPSAFGSKSVFYENEFPFAERIIGQVAQIDDLKEPNPRTDGLLPFTLQRLRSCQSRIEDAGHRIRFSVSRGPLNIASFLMGTTEFLMALKTEPRRMHKLLQLITGFLKKWHELQRETFPLIDGVFILDDIVGFISGKDFVEFGLPYLKELYAGDLTVKFFHNDAQCASSIGYYPEIGINLYNPGIFHSLAELRRMASGRLAILGTLPPREVLADGSPEQVRAAVQQLLAENPDHARLVLSCAGGMPPGVGSENIRAFVEAAAGCG